MSGRAADYESRHSIFHVHTSLILTSTCFGCHIYTTGLMFCAPMTKNNTTLFVNLMPVRPLPTELVDLNVPPAQHKHYNENNAIWGHDKMNCYDF